MIILKGSFLRSAKPGSGQQLRAKGEHSSLDITRGNDVSSGIITTAEHLAEGRGFAPKHLTTGAPTSLMELGRTVVRLADSKSANPRKFDVANFFGDPQLAERENEWKPKINLGDDFSAQTFHFRKARSN